MYRTYTVRLHPTCKQRIALERCLRLQRELYNAALEERRGAYAWNGKSPSRIDQFKTLTGLSDLRPEYAPFGITVSRGTLARLDEAFQGFFRRVKVGEKPGYPRFQGANRFDSLSWSDKPGWKIDTKQRRLYLQGIGHTRANYHRPLRGIPKTLTVRRRGRHYDASIFCADVPKQPLPETGRVVGIDLGVRHLVADSNGILYENPRYRKNAEERLATEQRERARHHRGTCRARRANGHIAHIRSKETNRRKDTLHKLSRQLVNDNDLIVHEALKIKNMSRSAKGTVETPGTNVAAKSGLNTAILDSGWGKLIQMLTYKAEDAGRQIIQVNPKYTSQRCYECEYSTPENRREEKFNCKKCGWTDHADINAAKNILRAGLAQGGIQK